MSPIEAYSHPAVQNMIRVTRIIVIALVIGVAFFGGFVLMNPPQQRANNPRMFFTLIAIPFSLGAVVSSLIFPRLAVRGNIKAIAAGQWPMGRQRQYTQGLDLSSDEAKLALVYQNTTIIRAALLEGASFFTWFAYWQEGEVLALGIVFVLMLLLVACFPLTDRVGRWIQDRARELDELRNLERR